MLTIFNRRELLTTFDMKEQSRIREVLAANSVDYAVKANDPSARTFVGGAAAGAAPAAWALISPPPISTPFTSMPGTMSGQNLCCDPEESNVHPV